jgi:phytoene synthase
MSSTLREETGASSLPKPFYGRPWSGEQRNAAHALWIWYSRIPEIVADRFDAEVALDWCSSAAEMVEAQHQPDFIDDEIWSGVEDACRQFDLSFGLLGEQLKAAHVYAGSVRFADAAALQEYIRQHPFAHARLLAQLGEVDYTWQQNAIEDLARAFFITNHLAHLPRDLERDRLFLPLQSLRNAGVSEQQLRDGTLDKPLRNVLWKFQVRARDAYAQGQSLLNDLPWWFRGPFKRAWLGGLEVLRMIERRDYDVWTHEIEFSMWQRIQIFFQALAGRTTFRSS